MGPRDMHAWHADMLQSTRGGKYRAFRVVEGLECLFDLGKSIDVLSADVTRFLSDPAERSKKIAPWLPIIVINTFYSTSALLERSTLLSDSCQTYPAMTGSVRIWVTPWLWNGRRTCIYHTKKSVQAFNALLRVSTRLMRSMERGANLPITWLPCKKPPEPSECG